MTTPEAAVAEYWRLKPLIYRDPPGFGNPVTVQEWAPNTPRYSWASMGSVDHCGLSMNTLLHNIGLVFERDFPNCAWTPSARQWADEQSPVVLSEIRAGDLLLYRDAGSAYPATHIGIALGDWDGGGVLSGEFNTTEDGMGREYRRTPGYLVAAGRPAYVAPVVPIDRQVYDWCAAHGLSAAGAAGVMGNFQAESGMDPGIVEGGTHSLDDLVPGVREGIGLLQWSYSRREALLTYAASRGRPWQDVEVQLDFMAAEIADGYGAMWSGLQLAADPRVASQLFARTFVRPGVYGARDDYAATYYDRIMAGEFGDQPTPPRPRFVPFTIPGTQEDTMQIIRREGQPPIGAMLGVPFPIEDASVGGSGVTEVHMSEGVFQKLHRNWMDANGLKLAKVGEEWRYVRVPLPTE